MFLILSRPQHSGVQLGGNFYEKLLLSNRVLSNNPETMCDTDHEDTHTLLLPYLAIEMKDLIDVATCILEFLLLGNVFQADRDYLGLELISFKR